MLALLYEALIDFPAIRDNGVLVGFSKVTRDITEKKQAEMKLMQAKQVAEAASQAKQSFLAMMSHEIRTPLHAVITLSQLLLDTSLNTIQHDYLDTIHNSSKQLLSIINDILDFSKIVRVSNFVNFPLLTYDS